MCNCREQEGIWDSPGALAQGAGRQGILFRDQNSNYRRINHDEKRYTNKSELNEHLTSVSVSIACDLSRWSGVRVVGEEKLTRRTLHGHHAGSVLEKNPYERVRYI